MTAAKPSFQRIALHKTSGVYRLDALRAVEKAVFRIVRQGVEQFRELP